LLQSERKLAELIETEGRPIGRPFLVSVHEALNGFKIESLAFGGRMLRLPNASSHRSFR
jgi:hypothetical protein